jgi:hypothetical protein
MENLWKQLKPAVKKQILADKDIYPHMVATIKSNLTKHKFWSDLSVETARQVVSFSHFGLLEVSISDLLWGEKFLKKTKNG